MKMHNYTFRLLFNLLVHELKLDIQQVLKHKNYHYFRLRDLLAKDQFNWKALKPTLRKRFEKMGLTISITGEVSEEPKLLEETRRLVYQDYIEKKAREDAKQEYAKRIREHAKKRSEALKTAAISMGKRITELDHQLLNAQTKIEILITPPSSGSVPLKSFIPSNEINMVEVSTDTDSDSIQESTYCSVVTTITPAFNAIILKPSVPVTLATQEAHPIKANNAALEKQPASPKHSRAG